MIEAEI